MMKLKSILLALTLSLSPLAALANDEVKSWKSYDSLGCMLLQECTEGVTPVVSMLDIANVYPESSYDHVTEEFNTMLTHLRHMGVTVYLADEKYFPPNHRGVYHTVGNNFFLNDSFMHEPHVVMAVMRHEGWHAAQDCMAGSIDNSLIAIIKPEESIPTFWRDTAERLYPESSRAWEAEALWAGHTEGVTMNALAACTTGAMWEIYEPTPLTREYLVKYGYIVE